MARPRASGPVTLDLLYDALMTVVDEIDAHREQWQEAESSLIARMDLRDGAHNALGEAHHALELRVEALEKRDTERCSAPPTPDG